MVWPCQNGAVDRTTDRWGILFGFGSAFVRTLIAIALLPASGCDSDQGAVKGESAPLGTIVECEVPGAYTVAFDETVGVVWSQVIELRDAAASSAATVGSSGDVFVGVSEIGARLHRYSSAGEVKDELILEGDYIIRGMVSHESGQIAVVGSEREGDLSQPTLDWFDGDFTQLGVPLGEPSSDEDSGPVSVAADAVGGVFTLVNRCAAGQCMAFVEQYSQSTERGWSESWDDVVGVSVSTLQANAPVVGFNSDADSARGTVHIFDANLEASQTIEFPDAEIISLAADLESLIGVIVQDASGNRMLRAYSGEGELKWEMSPPGRPGIVTAYAGRLVVAGSRSDTAYLLSYASSGELLSENSGDWPTDDFHISDVAISASNQVVILGHGCG